MDEEEEDNRLSGNAVASVEGTKFGDAVSVEDVNSGDAASVVGVKA